MAYLRRHYATFAEVAIVNTVQGHVLFSQDDPSTRQAAANFFEEHNNPVCSVAGGHPLREIRSRTDVPTIVAGSDHSDENDRIVALELGADNDVSDHEAV